MTYRIISWSGGADSTCTVILAHELGIHIDLIIFSEVMFDENISGELPEHIDFIKNKCIPLFESWGYKVEILHSDKTYMDCFNHVINNPSKTLKNKGKKYGFPMAGKCAINDRCKVSAIKKFYKKLNIKDVIHYVGICSDEPTRLARLENTNRVSLLAENDCTQEMARAKCREYGLLSPIYEFSKRGGCWFCPNAKDDELRNLRDNHPDLWNKLLALEDEPNLVSNMWNTLTKTRIHDIEERFMWEDRQMTIFDFIEEKEE